MTEKQLIIMEAGKTKETLTLLLGLADRPQDVAYPGNGHDVYVPDYLMDRYIKATTPPRKRAKNTEKED